MNSIDKSGKIECTMSIANSDSVLKFFDLTLHINEHDYIDMNAKPTNSFTYFEPLTCYPKKYNNKVSKGIALKHRRICSSDKEFHIRSSKYQNYLTARYYNPTLVKKNFTLCD